MSEEKPSKLAIAINSILNKEEIHSHEVSWDDSDYLRCVNALQEPTRRILLGEEKK